MTVDCDVIQADGGTRVASVSAAWVALHMAFETLVSDRLIPSNPLLDSVAAVSVGIVKDNLLLDLDYDEDSVADVDMNVVMTGTGRLVEVQATAEHKPFSLEKLNSLVRLARLGIKAISKIQLESCEGIKKTSNHLRGESPHLNLLGASSSPPGSEKPGPDSSGSCLVRLELPILVFGLMADNFSRSSLLRASSVVSFTACG